LACCDQIPGGTAHVTVSELYQFSVDLCRGLDPRGDDALSARLAELAGEYGFLDGAARDAFDAARLTNPFGDTRIVCGAPEREVRRLICGIDIDATEVLLADRLADHGRPVDLVVAHHASAIGGALGSRRDTIWPQVKLLTDFGVPEHRAHKLVRRAAGAGEERSSNHKINQVAEALGMPLMTIHSPADILVHHEGQSLLSRRKPQTVGDLVALCDEWPEVRWLVSRGVGTRIAVGDEADPLGRVYACFYGGWNPTGEVVEALCDAGCGTLWVVATNEGLNEVARRRDLSVVVVPHHPADNVGLNLLWDRAMDRFGDFEIVPASNFVRFDRRSGGMG